MLLNVYFLYNALNMLNLTTFVCKCLLTLLTSFINENTYIITYITYHASYNNFNSIHDA